MIYDEFHHLKIIPYSRAPYRSKVWTKIGSDRTRQSDKSSKHGGHFEHRKLDLQDGANYSENNKYINIHDLVCI